MGYEGYVSLIKGGTYVRRASLVHMPLFLWGDDYGRDRIFSQANQEVLGKLAKLTGTSRIKASDFIYKNGSFQSASYRFSKNVADQCAAFVRMGFLKRTYEGEVARLYKRTVRKKKKSISLLGNLLTAKDPEHIGVLFGSTVKAIQSFRTNMRDETGETKHTGYVVGIPHNLYSMDKRPEDKDKGSKISFTKFNKSFLGKKLVKSEKVYLSDKLSWLEHGSWKQQPRRIFSIAIADYLKVAGFEIGNGIFSFDSSSPVAPAKGKKSSGGGKKTKTTKARVKKGSKVEKFVKPVSESVASLVGAAIEAETGIKFEFKIRKKGQ